MGQPFDGGSPGGAGRDPGEEPSHAAAEQESEGEEPEGLEELVEGWIRAGGLGAAEEWEDPSADGVLTEVLRAAEEGDAAALPGLIDALSVSLDTLVGCAGCKAGRGGWAGVPLCSQVSWACIWLGISLGNACGLQLRRA